MFDGLQNKLQDVFHQLKGEKKVSKEVLDAALRQIRVAMLEADVNFRVVKTFIGRIRERAEGQEVMQSLTPAQQVIKIVRDELGALLGETGEELQIKGSPSVTMLCGLQGSGKTTTCGKLAKRLRGKGKQPLLVAGDLQRAAAVEQLTQVGAQAGVPVLGPNPGEDPVALAKRALKTAKELGHDVLIFDSAGRLHVDEALMDELRRVAEVLQPIETLFVADAMTGQDAVKSAEEFGAQMPLTGIVLTKLDGDARGGAALSIRAVTKVPLRYIGTGEKLEDLDLFHPDRMTSRILGMGDILTLIEKAEQGLDSEETERLAKRMVSQEFTLEDLRDQLRQIRKMGPMSQIMELLPNAGMFKGAKVDDAKNDKEFKKIEAIINSMTPKERSKPALLNAKRKKRIAKGSGTRVQDINRLLKQYQQMRKMMKKMGPNFMKRAMGGMGGGLGGLGGGAFGGGGGGRMPRIPGFK